MSVFCYLANQPCTQHKKTFFGLGNNAAACLYSLLIGRQSLWGSRFRKQAPESCQTCTWNVTICDTDFSRLWRQKIEYLECFRCDISALNPPTWFQVMISHLDVKQTCWRRRKWPWTKSQRQRELRSSEFRFENIPPAQSPIWGVELIVVVKKLSCKKERTPQQTSNVNNTAELVTNKQPFKTGF